MLTKDSISTLENSIKNEFKLSVFNLFLNSLGDIILSDIEVPKQFRKQGIGSKVLTKLIQIADDNNLRIVLTPGLRDTKHGATSRARLINFYKRFGFVLNKGRNKDFRVSELMIREPKAIVTESKMTLSDFILIIGYS